MLDFIKTKLKENKEFLKDNLILFISFFILNVMSYFFHFYTGRKFGPYGYGILGSLLTLIYIIIIPLSALQTTITKFVSGFKAKNEYKKIAYLLSKSFKKLFFYGVIATLVFLLISPLIASFLKIESIYPLIILSSFIALAFLLLLIRGVLQGLQRFKLLGLGYIAEGIGKLGGSVLLVYLGFGINGAIGGITISFLLSFIVIFIYMIAFLKMEKEEFNTKEIYKYSFPVLIMLVSLTLFFSIDILLVKHFFDSVNAGYYAALSLLGKIIFFGSWSTSMVMFPKVSEAHALNKEHKNFLYKSLLLILSFGLTTSLFYFIFPKFTINLLFGKDYLIIADLLGLFGIFITIFSLIYITSFYYVSINKTRFIYLLILFNILEGGLIWFFHESLRQIVILLIVLMAILFICLFIPIILQKNVQKNFNNNTRI